MSEGATAGEQSAKQRGRAKLREGVVVSDKMNKSVVVEVTRTKKHPRYGKYIKCAKKYLAHDEENACGAGDRVSIVETRPLSKLKRWRVQNIIEKAL